MTNKDRVAVLAIFVSVLGFSFVAALKPVMISYVAQQGGIYTSFSINNSKLALKSVHFRSGGASSKMVRMLSEVLGIPQEDVILSLEGGSKPSEMLMSSGVFLSDLAEEYSFDIFGDGLVRFRA